MPGLLLMLTLQAVASTAPQTAPPAKFSILQPVANEPCVRKPSDDIVVCGDPLPSQKLTPRADFDTDGPDWSGLGPFAVKPVPCLDKIRGCLVGFGPPIIPLAKAAVGVVKRTFAKKPDKAGRVAIPLDDPEPTGRIEP